MSASAIDDSFSEEAGSAVSFTVRDGETYINAGNSKEEEEFGDFTLKFVAHLTDKGNINEGFWICQCGCLINRELVSREVVLPTSAFDSKQKFLTMLRQEFQGGTFSLFAACNNRFVTEFYKYLKRDFEAGEQRHCTLMKHVGYQGNGYWCLSDEIQIKDGKLVSPEMRQYRCADKKEFMLFNNTLEQKLLSQGYLSDVVRRFITLAKCWGKNEDAFLAASAFVCLHLMQEVADDNAGQANVGMIFSPCKSVGKSLTARMLAYAQGVPGLKHNQLLAGGDQVMSGVTSKKVLEALAKTTFVVVIDDVKMTDSLGEFLLQVQGGLLQGSAQAGINCPLGSILLTSNVKESDRLHGRIIHFVYEKEDGFSSAKENAIMELMALICNNKGFLTVWSMLYKDVFTMVSEGAVLGKLLDILSSTIQRQQPRWYKGVATVLITHAMLLMSCGMLADQEKLIDLVIKYILHYQECTGESEHMLSVIQKLDQTIINECQKEDGRDMVKTWLNCMVKVNCNGKMVNGLAIKSSQLVHWPHIGRKELAEEALMHGQAVNNISVPFAPTMPTDSKYKKAIKFPQSLFSQTMLDIVGQVCGGKDKGDICEMAGPASSDDSEDNATGESCPLDSDQLNSVRAVFTSLVCNVPLLRACDLPDSDSEESNYFETTAMELTPKSRSTWDAFTPKRKKAFEVGYLAGAGAGAGAKRRIRVDDNESDECRTQEGKDKGDEVLPGISEDTRDVSCSIGVRKKTKLIEDEESCKLCSMSTPPGAKRKNNRGMKNIDWVQCDNCDGWFHLVCSGLTKKPEKKEMWHCANCKRIRHCSQK